MLTNTCQQVFANLLAVLAHGENPRMDWTTEAVAEERHISKNWLRLFRQFPYTRIDCCCTYLNLRWCLFDVLSVS